MNARPLVFSLLLSALLSNTGFGQQTNSPQQIACMSWLAVNGSTAQQLKGIQLRGEVAVSGGAEEHAGSITLTADGISQSRMDLDLDNGRTIEIRTNGGNSWTDTAGAVHQFPNSGSPNAWFAPGLISPPPCATKATFFTRSTSSPTGFVYASNSSVSPRMAPAANEYSLDSQTLLPMSVIFNEHPDDDLNSNIRVEIRYSDYRLVQGVRVAFRIQRFVNGTLALDIKVTAATINPPSQASEFQLN